MSRSYKFLISLSMTLFLLQACGGGGGGSEGPNVNVPSYGGLTSQAMIDTGNSRDLSTAAASGALQSVVGDSANIFARSAPRLESKVFEISPKIAKWIVQSELLYAAKTANLSALCSAGGSAIADSNDAETEGTITFTNCGISDGAGGAVFLTGQVNFSYNAATDTMSMAFYVTASYAGESTDMSLSLSCVDFNSASPTCSASSDFVGLDNRTCRVENIAVTGSAVSGFDVNATIYDPDHGYVTMNTDTPLTFGCATGVPGTGSIVLSGASATQATITFVSCDEFNVTIDSVGETFYW